MRYAKQQLSEIDSWPLPRLYRIAQLLSEIVGEENGKKSDKAAEDDDGEL